MAPVDEVQQFNDNYTRYHLLQTNYNKDVAPPVDGNGPVHVNVYIFIKDINSISESSMVLWQFVYIGLSMF